MFNQWYCNEPEEDIACIPRLIEHGCSSVFVPAIPVLDDYTLEPHIISPQSKKLKTTKAKTEEDIEMENCIQCSAGSVTTYGLSIDGLHDIQYAAALMTKS